jgi:four helix bundle protein
MQEQRSKSYKDLVVWKKSCDLVILIYKLCSNFPKEELYGITSQIKRSAISIPSNIAEGSRRGTKKDFQHFLNISLGSAAELETQLEISKKLSFGEKRDYNEAESILLEVTKMLYKLSSTLN